MAKQRIILVLVVCFSITVFTGQMLSLARISKRTRIPPVGPDPKRLLGLTAEEMGKEISKFAAQRRQQELKRDIERSRAMTRQAWKRLLWVSERQWKLIEPKERKLGDLFIQARVGAGCGIRRNRNEQYFHWNRPSESPQHPMKGKARDQMPEGYRIVEELIDLLEDENAKDEEIRQKIDALQQAREKARKQLPEARKELAKVLTSPRQEAVFLLTGDID